MSVLADKIKKNSKKKSLVETTYDLYPIDKEILNEMGVEIVIFLIALLGALGLHSIEDFIMRRTGVNSVFKNIKIDLEDQKLSLNQVVRYIKKNGNKEDIQKIKEITKRIRKNTIKEFWVLATTYKTRVRAEDVFDILKIYNDVKDRVRATQPELKLAATI